MYIASVLKTLFETSTSYGENFPFNTTSLLKLRIQSKRIEISRGTATDLPVLAERVWRFSVVESENSIVPKNSPKSKPLIGATGELLLFTFASCGANQ